MLTRPAPPSGKSPSLTHHPACGVPHSVIFASQTLFHLSRRHRLLQSVTELTVLPFQFCYTSQIDPSFQPLITVTDQSLLFYPTFLLTLQSGSLTSASFIRPVNMESHLPASEPVSTAPNLSTSPRPCDPPSYAVVRNAGPPPRYSAMGRHLFFKKCRSDHQQMTKVYPYSLRPILIVASCIGFIWAVAMGTGSIRNRGNDGGLYRPCTFLRL